MARRYFEFSEGTKVLTRYGKIGAAGQTTVKDEGSPERAKDDHYRSVSVSE